MAEKLPLVYVDGELSQLPPGDQAEGGELGNLIAGSGLVGGGDLQTGSKRLDVALAPNPSGLIFVGDTVGMDGADLVAADVALASGNAALVDAVPALASGVAGLDDATTALASGNAALSEAANFVGSSAVILTASSVIQAGSPVGLDDAGKASVITEAEDTSRRSFGTPAFFNSASSYSNDSVYDPVNNRVVVVFSDGSNSNYGTAVVGTVSGSTISFGTPVAFESSGSNYFGIAFDSANSKVVIAYQASSVGKAVVGTVSGTSISFGTAVNFDSAQAYYNQVAFDSTNNKVVIAYTSYVSSFNGDAVVGTVSGTSISFGTPVRYRTNSLGTYGNVVFDSTNDRVVVSYRDGGNSNYGTAVVGEVSGTSITFGTPVVFEAAAMSYLSSVFDSSNSRVVFAYRDEGNSNYATAIVGEVSGSSITFGSAVVFDAKPSANMGCAFDSTENQIVIAYRTQVSTPNIDTATVGNVSGSSISFGSPVAFDESGSEFTSVYNTTEQKVVIVYSDTANSYYGQAIVGSIGQSTFPTLGSVNNFIGTANSTVASGDSVKVNAPRSINYNNTGLSTGYFYYVDPSASGFTTTATQPSSWTAGDYSWGPVAKAVSSSGLLILDTI